MAKQFQNLTVDYKKLLNLSVSDRASMARSEYGQSLLSSLTPSQYASLFPSYYKDRLPDISGFTAASRGTGGTRTGYESSTTTPGGGGGGGRTPPSTTASAGRATPSYVRRLKEASGGVDISDPKAKAELSAEKKKVFDLLKKGQISADDPRAAFLKDISAADLKKAGIESVAGEGGKQSYQMAPTAASQMTDEELKKKIGSEKFEGGFASKSAKLTSDLMKDLGLTREQAAGLVGNLAHESAGLNINIEEKVSNKHGTKGYGLAQWTDNPPGKGRRTDLANFAESNGLPMNSYEAQYKFLIKELQTTESRALNLIRSAKTPEEAAAAAVAFERPQGYNSKNSDYVDAARNSLGWRDRLRYTNKSYEAAGDIANAGLPADATAQQVAEYRNKLIEQEENQRGEQLAASTLAKLPANIDPKFAQDYEKMSPGQKQRVQQAIAKLGEGEEGVNKFNKIYQENPTKTANMTGVSTVGNTKLPKTASDANKIVAETATGTLRYQASLIDKASALLGLDERSDKEAIKEYLRKSGTKSGQIDPEQTPWCAAFVNSTLAQSGIKPTGSNLAASYMNWGELKQASEVAAGDVLVRDGHVGLSTGKTKMVNGRLKIQMLGGNQSQKVTNNNWVDADSIQVRRAREEDYSPEVLEDIKKNDLTQESAAALQQKQQQQGVPVQEIPASTTDSPVSQQQTPGDTKLPLVGGNRIETLPPKESSTTKPVAEQQVAQSTDEVIPVYADGGAKEIQTNEITAYPIGQLKGDNSVVVDDNKKPLFTMNTDKESAHYDPIDKTVSVRPLDEKKNKLDKKPISGKAIPVLADGGEVDLQASAQGEPVSKVDPSGLEATPEAPANEAGPEPAGSSAGSMSQGMSKGSSGDTLASISETLKSMSANPITCPSFGRALAAANFKKSGDHNDGGATNVK